MFEHRLADVTGLSNQATAKEVVALDLDYMISAAKAELEQMSRSTLLITGGAGFLGYYFTMCLLEWNKRYPEKKIELWLFDNFQRGEPKWLKEASMQSDLHVMKRDINDPLPVDIGVFNYVVHAASIASPIFYRRHPIATMDANVNGLRSLLEYFVENKRKGDDVRRMLYFSTSEIYGDPTPENIPTSEEYRGNVSCTGPRACYDESKRYGETLCVNFAREHALPVSIARPFNNYGPGLKITDGRVIPDFCRNILKGKDIELLSDGAPTRTFCYVADAIVGYLKILVNGRLGEPYNIGTESPEVSVRKLAEMLISSAQGLLDYEGTLLFRRSDDSQYLTDNPHRRCPIIEKARTELGYDPKISIQDGLLRTLIWYRDNFEDQEL